MRETLTFIFCVFCLVGCVCRGPIVRLPESQAQDLLGAVNEMVLKPGIITDSGEVPRDLWPEAIRKLRPITVYIHVSNIVIVLSRDAHEERGYYVEPVVSSYAPDPAESDWTWTKIGDSSFLYAYTRKR